MKAPIIMDINNLALSLKGWIPLYLVKVSDDSTRASYPAYMPFRSKEKFVNVPAMVIQNLMDNEQNDLARQPQMIPRVMVRI